ncbi:hypothetical protein IP88_03175 [alpha proteobacterium AAP81b]|nr:hypothetical protein IP88_03175 [alpha proteobacterium AAP81b]
MLLLAGVAAIAGCAPKPPPEPIAVPPAPAIVAEAEADRMVRASIAGGEIPVPVPPQSVRQIPGSGGRPGDIEVNFPSADAATLAKAVGDVLKVRITVAPGVTQPVTLVTPGPVSRETLLSLYEAALRNAGLALSNIDGNFLVQPIAAVQGQGVGGPTTLGYATEIIRLQFIAASELKKILDPLLPGVVTATDAAGPGSITIAGTTGQRSSVRDLVKQFDVNWLRNMSFGLFVPQRTDARLIVPELEKLINAADAPTKGLVRLIAMEKLNGIMAITGNRQYLDDVRRWIEILDREGESAAPRLFVYRVQNGRARDLARTLGAAFGTGGGDTGGAGQVDPFANQQNGEAAPVPAQRGAARIDPNSPAPTGGGGAAGLAGLAVRINADEVNNAIIVYGAPRDYAVVEDALRRLDIPPAQVLIEAAITEVTLTDALRFGVQWNFQAGNANFAQTEGATVNPTRLVPGFSFFYGANGINATLNALETRTNIKVISAPKLLVLNNQTAALQVGNQVPILTQQSVSNDGGGGIAPTVNSVSYRDTGVILRITPRVNAGGVVLLDISQEVSGVSDAQSGVDSPTFTTRRVASTIAAQDGQVLAIGGLFTNSQTRTKAGIPILSRIPVLGGFLFGRDNNNDDRTELIILIKPTVLRGVDDGRAVTEELRAKLKTLEPFKTKGRIP